MTTDTTDNSSQNPSQVAKTMISLLGFLSAIENFPTTQEDEFNPIHDVEVHLSLGKDLIGEQISLDGSFAEIAAKLKAELEKITGLEVASPRTLDGVVGSDTMQ